MQGFEVVRGREEEFGGGGLPDPLREASSISGKGGERANDSKKTSQLEGKMLFVQIRFIHTNRVHTNKFYLYE